MVLEDISGFLVSPADPLRRVVEVIDRNEMQIALVVDGDGKLLGTVTDGDIRRGLLAGVDLTTPASAVMNSQPVTVDVDYESSSVEALMLRTGLRRIPLLDRGRLLGMVVPQHEGLGVRDCLVVLMAGGLGTRLGDLTRDVPKPLLKVGSKPILQTILECFIEQGFNHFLISVNYRADMIEGFFGDGSRWGVDIGYLREDQRLGTAGALSLIEQPQSGPFIVMNGDLLTRVDFRRLYDFHVREGFRATMAVRDYEMKVPFGVVEFESSRVRTIEEKPVRRVHANAGIYVFEPDCLPLLKFGHHLDMTSLLQRMLALGWPVGAYPIHEYWIDVGRPDDLNSADALYGEIFPDLAER